MADTMRPISSLPTIKCSDCGHEIEISNMADHICASVSTASPQQASIYTDRRPTYGANLAPQPSGYAKPGRLAPLQINSRTANEPFNAPQNTRTPESDYGLSPATRLNDSPSPGNTSSFQYSYAQHTDPYGTTYGDQKPPPQKRYDSAVASPESDFMYPSASPRSGGDHVLKRMDSIAPGPFSSRGGRKSGANSSAGDDAEHRKMASMNSMRQNARVSGEEKDSSRHSKDPSVASMSDLSRTSVHSNRSVGLPSRPNVLRQSPNIPPPRPSRPDHVDEDLEKMQRQSRSKMYEENFVPNGVARSVTEPVPQSDNPFGRGRRHPSDGTNALPAQSLSRSRSRGKVDPRIEDAPPVPPAPKLRNPFVENRSHAPSDSGSSDASLSSNGARTASSRSSPPSSEASSISRRPSVDTHGGFGGMEAKGLGIQGASLPSSPRAGLQGIALQSTKRRQNAPEPIPTTRYGRDEDGPESPMDPAIQQGLFKSPPPPRQKAAPPSFEKALPSHPEKDDNGLPPPPPRDAPVRRGPTMSKKGNCRGCMEPIVGKSVKAADGSLTGRYHKHCFVCKTCKAPFQTADFYVHEDLPYCEHHYHQLNNSLCTSCNHGIEGQYLETDYRQKFHPRCFTCVTCRTMLRDDYFEVSGKVYCERHAFSAAQQMRFPGGARRNPERRTTRLMMM